MKTSCTLISQQVLISNLIVIQKILNKLGRDRKQQEQINHELGPGFSSASPQLHPHSEYGYCVPSGKQQSLLTSPEAS